MSFRLALFICKFVVHFVLVVILTISARSSTDVLDDIPYSLQNRLTDRQDRPRSPGYTPPKTSLTSLYESFLFFVRSMTIFSSTDSIFKASSLCQRLVLNKRARKFCFSFYLTSKTLCFARGLLCNLKFFCLFVFVELSCDVHA